MSSSSFSDLCSDVLLDIFSYFSLNELSDIFIDSIPHLSNLLNQSHIKLHIDENTNEDFWMKILPQINLNQIISLNNYHSMIDLSQFSSIHSMKLNLRSSFLFNQFQSLIHLEQLSLKLSNTIIEEDIWLSHILNLPNLRKLKIDSVDSKNPFLPQKQISIKESSLRSNSIKYLEINVPMICHLLLSFLQHFPNLQTFRASLYQIISFVSNPLALTSNISRLNSLQRLDLQGYLHNVSSMVTYVSSSMPNLKRCRLISLNVTDDDAFGMKNPLIWKHLFNSCSHLIQVKIHILMSVEVNNIFNVRSTKDLLWAFNNNLFSEKYNFRMELPSINRGYVTLTGNYDVRKIKL